MSQRSIAHALILPLLLACGLALADRATSAPPPRRAADEGPLAEHMETLSSAVKRLRRTIPEASQRADSLATLVEAQRAVLEVKQMTPPLAAKQPEAERAAFIAAYRKTIAELLGKLLELEVALLDGDQARIDEAYKRVRAMEDSGHERFTEDG